MFCASCGKEAITGQPHCRYCGATLINLFRETDMPSFPKCKICDRGELAPSKVRRLSGPAVVIGYILLIPSVLGMIACGAMLIMIFAVSTPSDNADAAVIGTGMVIAGFVGCFVSGLLGWLLVMKKDVLQCDNCGATISAHLA